MKESTPIFEPGRTMLSTLVRLYPNQEDAKAKSFAVAVPCRRVWNTSPDLSSGGGSRT